MSYWHLAQINVARAVAAADSEVMADFYARIPAVNAGADASPGFIWRLQDESGDATSIRTSEDPFVLVNMSVWKNLDSLKAFVYRSSHATVFSERERWFEKPTVAHQALWWIPAGHIPSLEEGNIRLERLRSAQPTRFAFTFTHAFAAPPEPPAHGPGPVPQLYDGKRLRVISNTGPAGIGPGEVFEYRQDGARVWSVYHTEQTRFGSLVASVDPEGKLDLRYQQLDPKGTPRTGKCVSTPEQLPDGRLRLHEAWQWTNGDGSQGESILEEVPAGE